MTLKQIARMLRSQWLEEDDQVQLAQYLEEWARYYEGQQAAVERIMAALFEAELLERPWRKIADEACQGIQEMHQEREALRKRLSRTK